MDNESPELIQQDMADTRQSITAKVAALEVQMTEKLDHASMTVKDTVHSVKDAVSDTVDAVSGKVKHTACALQDSVSHIKSALDVRDQIRDNPWSIMAGAAIAGAVVGYLFGPHRTGASRTGTGRMQAATAYAPASSPQPAKPGVLDELLGRLQQELKVAGEAAITTVGAAFRSNLQEGIQGLVENAFSSVTDRDDVDGDGSGHRSQHAPLHNGRHSYGGQPA